MSSAIPTVTPPHRRTSSKSTSHLLSYDSHPLRTLQTEELPPSPSKDRVAREKSGMRDWTFPRGSGKIGGGTLRGGGEKVLLEGGVGSKSGDSTLGNTKSDGTLGMIPEDSGLETSNGSTPSPLTTTPRRISSSVAYAGSTTSSSRSTSPSDIIRLLYFNLRRRSLTDLIMGIIFLSCVLVFVGALTGFGVDPASLGKSQETIKVLPIKLDTDIGNDTNNVIVPSLVVPLINSGLDSSSPISDSSSLTDLSNPPNTDQSSLLPSLSELQANEPYPADIHQPQGDTSHDTSPDLLSDSPDLPHLDDKHVHHAHHVNPEPLFGESGDLREVEGLDVLQEEAEEAMRVRAESAELLEEGFDAHRTVISIGTPDVRGKDVEKSKEVTTPVVLHIVDEVEDLTPPLPAFQRARAPLPVLPIDDSPESTIDLEEQNRRDQQAHGDSFRRPSGFEGIEALKKGRDEMAAERDKWLAEIRAGTRLEESGESGRSRERPTV